MTKIDATAAVREGEELDAERLSEYMRETVGGTGEAIIEQFPGGHSNLTYLIRYGGGEYVLRRPPHGTRAKNAHDMSREFRVLSALGPVWELAPTPVSYCEDESVVGAPFYLMQPIRGTILRSTSKLDFDQETGRAICESFIDTLAKLHDLDYEEVGLGDFGRPAGYTRRQVEGWTRRYGKAKTHEIPEVEKTAFWLAEHLPDDDDDALIHNDFKLDNLVLDPADLTRVIGILDWEMCTVGHPLMDLGSTLSYWVEPDDLDDLRALPFGPINAPGMLTRTELVQRYQEVSGVPVENPVYYYVFGLFKTAVVVQQIYQRHHEGHTQDQRFANMLDAVRILSRAATSAIGRGSL